MITHVGQAPDVRCDFPGCLRRFTGFFDDDDVTVKDRALRAGWRWVQLAPRRWGDVCPSHADVGVGRAPAVGAAEEPQP